MRGDGFGDGAGPTAAGPRAAAGDETAGTAGRRSVTIAPTFEAWQVAARGLLRDRVPPAAVTWEERPDAPAPDPTPAADPTVRVPRRFVDVARSVAAGGGAPWPLLYRVLWRLVHEGRHLLDAARDPDVARLLALEREAARADALVPAPPGGAGAFLPAVPDIAALRAAAVSCRGCDLHRHATQTVFSAGPADARVVLVGEQPGDQEDLRGAPFVGPAGEVLDRALAEVGLARDRLYVTNVVKHFKFVPRGKRRLHQTPTLADIGACRPWLEAELAALRPEVLVCLGATASRALLGPEFRLLRDRGRFRPSPWAPRTIATLHPSAVLRGEDEPAQARLYAMLRDDLRLVAGVVAA
jgi:DNA polymerase